MIDELSIWIPQGWRVIDELSIWIPQQSAEGAGKSARREKKIAARAGVSQGINMDKYNMKDNHGGRITTPDQTRTKGRNRTRGKSHENLRTQLIDFDNCLQDSATTAPIL